MDRGRSPSSRARTFADLPLIAGGRSAGARVACRTANEVGAIGVLCLAFPLLPPQRAGGKPPQSRLPELETPDASRSSSSRARATASGCRRTATAARSSGSRGDHGLKKDRERLTGAVSDWLERVLA